MPYCWKLHVGAQKFLKWPQLCGGHLCLYTSLHHERMSMSIQIPERWLNRAHPAISHCSHLFLKCRAATHICHWLKVQSRWFKNYIFAKKCILISFWIFEYCFYYSFTLYHCTIFYSLDAGFFQYHPGV